MSGGGGGGGVGGGGSAVRTISAKGDVSVTADAVTETAAMISAHLTDERVCALCDFVVSRLMPLHASDLEQWSDDPEVRGRSVRGDGSVCSHSDDRVSELTTTDESRWSDDPEVS